MNVDNIRRLKRLHRSRPAQDRHKKYDFFLFDKKRTLPVQRGSTLEGNKSLKKM